MGRNGSELEIGQKNQNFTNVFKSFKKQLSHSPRLSRKNTSISMKTFIAEPKLSHCK